MGRPLNILMVCQHYWPEHFQVTEVCEELVRRGHEVTALVGIPNYPTGTVPEEYLDGRNREQVRNGVRIVRVEEVPRKPGVAGLARNYLSYMLSADARLESLPGGYDVILAYQLTPVLMAEPAMRGKKALRGARPALLRGHLARRRHGHAAEEAGLRAARRPPGEHRYLRARDIVATNSRAYIDCFESVHRLRREDCRYVPQYAEDSYLEMDLDAQPSDKTRFMVMGNIGKLQHLEVLMEAVDRLKGRGDFELHVVGTGSVMPWMQGYVEEHGLKRHVVFHGRRPFGEMPSFYRMADACVLTLHVPGAPWISSTLPSRLQGYMAAGKPVIAAIDAPPAEVIAESGCGASVSGTDGEGLARLMEDFIDNRAKYAECGERGRRYFRAHFMKGRYMDEIESLLREASERK